MTNIKTKSKVEEGKVKTKYSRPKYWPKTDRKMIEYLLRCSENITERPGVRSGPLTPPLLQLFKMTAEIGNYL
ncbi:MAG: hypothetical protein AAB922_04500 [Patescibacteria group bacterium]